MEFRDLIIAAYLVLDGEYHILDNTLSWLVGLSFKFLYKLAMIMMVRKSGLTETIRFQ